MDDLLVYILNNKVSLSDIRRAENAALEKLGHFIIADVKNREIVPFLEGDLQNSMNFRVDPENGELVLSWNTPYARRRYYEEAKISTSKNRNAQIRWFDNYLIKGTPENKRVLEYYKRVFVKELIK